MIIESEHLRRILYLLYRSYSRLYRTYPPPRLLVNSVPKSGTHLVLELLRRVPHFRFYGLHLETRRFLEDPTTAQNRCRQPLFDHARLRKQLLAVPNGQFITAHFPHQPELCRLLDSCRFRIILVVRDPRDVCVSHAKYIHRLKRHPLHATYARMPDDATRLMTSIKGLTPHDGVPGLLDVGTRFRRFLGWYGNPHTLVCRFEDLIGPRGGGSREAQSACVSSILDHIHRPLSMQHRERLSASIWSPKSATFRKGQIHDWPNHFTQEHIEAFDALASDVVQRLGYPTSLSASRQPRKVC